MPRERYCIRCGRLVPPDEPLINGLCPQCYLKYHGVFASTPILNIVICPRCGSWYYRGEWYPPLPLGEVIRKVLIKESGKLLNREVKLLDAEITSPIYKINESQYAVDAKLHVLLADSYPAVVDSRIVLNIEKRVCPRCLRITGKAHKALVQIRSVRGRLDEEDRRIINKALNEPGIIEDIVEVKENKHGIDVKLLSSVTARRLSTILTREAGAKVTESFKQTHYRPSKGSWDGITTLSVRLPDIRVGDLVMVRGKPGVVRERDKHGFNVELFDDGSQHRLRYDDYWRGEVEKPGYMVYEKEYEVVAVDKSSVYMVEEDSGEFVEYPKTPSLSGVHEGDRVKRVRIKDKVYMVKE